MTDDDNAMEAAILRQLAEGKDFCCYLIECSSYLTLTRIARVHGLELRTSQEDGMRKVELLKPRIN